ncbi:hypothetical protein E2C01_049846 [Portunus trituberculatus]|uniref:Uncharacterized protein n=1 Tax=Portunus trituberculatus TaxID=210409 RepID=A0A5B7G7G4_PORTR|nr:hypothetical protein [Portunus trituberculatus]
MKTSLHLDRHFSKQSSPRLASLVISSCIEQGASKAAVISKVWMSLNHTAPAEQCALLDLTWRPRGYSPSPVGCSTDPKCPWTFPYQHNFTAATVSPPLWPASCVVSPAGLSDLHHVSRSITARDSRGDAG